MEFQVWPIIKWALIVLLAGFIGHFGKVLAQSVLAKMRAKRAGIPSPPADPYGGTGPELPVSDGDKEKEINLPSDRKDQIVDKKALKAMAKQTKKALKQNKKSSD